MKRQLLFGICTCVLIVGLAHAVDNSGRNSHFWITLQAQAGIVSGSDTDLVLANGYRRVDLSSSDLSCRRADQGANRVYQIRWIGNSFFGDGGAETLQFNAVVDFDGAVYTMEDVTVGGASLSANGLVLQDPDSRFAAKTLHLNFIVRNPALTVEDPDHAFADLPDGHTYGLAPYKPTTQAKLVRSADTFTGYCSPDGKIWTKIGEVAISMEEKVEMGMAVCSGESTALAKATFGAFSRVESTPAVRSKRR